MAWDIEVGPTLEVDGNGLTSVDLSIAGMDIQEDDYLLCWVFSRTSTTASVTLSEDDGYNEIATGGGTNREVWLLEKVAGASESAPTFPFSEDQGFAFPVLAFIVRIRGADPADPIDVLGTLSGSGGSTVSNMGPIAGITPTAADGLALLFTCFNNDAAYDDSPPLSGWTEERTATSTIGSDGLAAVFSLEWAGAPSATGDETIGVSGSGHFSGIIISLNPSPGAGGGYTPRLSLLGVG